MNKKHFFTFLKGLAMGSADIVPGVSGGSVAFILGIYQRLLQAISGADHQFLKLIFSLRFKQALERIDYSFLFPLMLGVFTAILSLAKLLHFLLATHPHPTWGLFFGLILGSIIYLYRSLDKSLSQALKWSFLLLGSLSGFGLVSLVPVQSPNTPLMIFFSGMISICAMILPGISGSFILLILGKYAFVTGAIKNPFHFDSLVIIGIFCLGALSGLISFTKILRMLLEKYHNQMVLFLVGLMAGSLKKIWPWKEELDWVMIRGKKHVLAEANRLPAEYDTVFFITLMMILLGFSLVLILELKRTSAKNA